MSDIPAGEQHKIRQLLAGEWGALSSDAKALGPEKFAEAVGSVVGRWGREGRYKSVRVGRTTYLWYADTDVFDGYDTSFEEGIPDGR